MMTSALKLADIALFGGINVIFSSTHIGENLVQVTVNDLNLASRQCVTLYCIFYLLF